MLRSVGFFIGLAALATAGIRLEAALGFGGAVLRAPAEFTPMTGFMVPWYPLLLAALGPASAMYCIRRYRLAARAELQRLRTRIATDLHDDIGASLSQLALLSEFVSRRPHSDPQATSLLGEIAGVSRQLVDSMSDIVWSIDPGGDSLGDMICRMRVFANDVFPSCGIAFQFCAPGPDDEVTLSSDTRRHMLLVFKESIHNIIRHAGCEQVEIGITIEGERLALKLTDDGKGFDCRQTSLGHGLNSMRNRARALGGELNVISSQAGTTVRLNVPISGRRLPAKDQPERVASPRDSQALAARRNWMGALWKRQLSA